MNRNAVHAIRCVLQTAAVTALCAIALRQPLLAAPTPAKVAVSQPLNHCMAQAVNYDGWKAEELSNRWVKLILFRS